jgi:pimeloyl-ACP methyl ester carboxylesterase
MMPKAIRFVGVLLLLFIGTACDRDDQLTCDETEVGSHLTYASHDIYYEVHGQGPRTLVFIHGWTGSQEIWKYQLDAFPEYRVIAIDLPGNGRSSRREGVPYTMEMFADTVYAVLDAKGVDRAYLFGHSMGFAVIEVFLAKYPKRCEGIAAIDGTLFEAPSDAAGQAKWRQSTEALAVGMTTEKAREDFFNMLLLPDTPANLKDDVLRISRTVPLTIGRAMIEGVVADIKYWLPRNRKIPCLAVYSPAYQLPPTYRDDFARSYPLVDYHQLSNVSHFFMLEIPYRLNQIIEDFVSR